MIFGAGIHYRDTPEYEKLRKEAADSASQPRTKGAVIGDVDAYYENLLSAWRSMREYGYRSQRDLTGRDSDKEITVWARADGTFAHSHYGSHRILMAELLGIAFVSVRVSRIQTALARQIVQDSDDRHPYRRLREWAAALECPPGANMPSA